MPTDRTKAIIAEIIKEVISAETYCEPAEAKKEKVKFSIMEKLKNDETYNQGLDSNTLESIEEIVCKLIDCVVITLNQTLGKNWLITILQRIL